MITWEKPSGLEITTNDLKETKEYCKSLGWKEKGAKKDEPVKETPVKTKAKK